jgi:hypothetical protein
LTCDGALLFYNLDPQHNDAQYYHGYSSGQARKYIQIELNRILFLFDRWELVFEIFCLAGSEALFGAISAIYATEENNDTH